jgi:hypothetical protein
LSGVATAEERVDLLGKSEAVEGACSGARSRESKRLTAAGREMGKGLRKKGLGLSADVLTQFSNDTC